MIFDVIVDEFGADAVNVGCILALHRVEDGFARAMPPGVSLV